MAEAPEEKRQPVSFQVPIKDIAVIDRARKIYNKVEALAVSLDNFGQIHAIRIRRPKPEELEAAAGKPWILVAGGRRMAAAMMNKWETIRAEDYDEMEPWKQLAIELEENLQRDDMHFSEIVANKAKLHERYRSVNPGWKLENTAELIGESIVNVSRDLALDRAIKENPSLKKATSKKAALQSVKRTQHLKARESQQTSNLQSRVLRSKVVTADARDWLRLQETASVDLVAGDLPYGIGYFDYPTSSNEGGGGLSEYDDSTEKAKDLIVDIVPELVRVTKPTGWIILFMNWELHDFLENCINTCCKKHFGYRVDDKHKRCSNTIAEASKYTCEYPKCEPIPWLWYRPNSRNNPQQPDLHAQNQYELITVCNMGQGRLVMEGRVGNVLEFDSEYSERVHAMEKPIELWKEVIQRVTVMGEKVIDPTFGSGTSLAAAAALGRDFTGCELNPGLLDSALGLVAQFYLGEIEVDAKYAADPEGLQPVPFA